MFGQLNLLFLELYLCCSRYGDLLELIHLNDLNYQKYSKVEYVQRCVYFVNVQSSLHENVVSYVCGRMGNAAHILSIMRNSISGLDAWYYLRFNISCGVAVRVKSHQQKFQVYF